MLLALYIGIAGALRSASRYLVGLAVLYVSMPLTTAGGACRVGITAGGSLR